MKKITTLTLVSLGVLAFTACGDSDTTSPKKESVETIFDLGKCNKARDGEALHVEDDDLEYTCSDGRWIAQGGEENSSSSKQGKQSSSSKKQKQDSSSSSKKEVDSSSSEKIAESSSSKEMDSSSSEVALSSESEEITSSAEDSEVSSSSESAENSSSSETEGLNSSSDAEELSSSSEVEKHSSSSVSSSSYDNPTPVMPSGTYDCAVYKCVTTEFLNQDFLAQGKYGEILDIRDKKVYKTIQIGNQVWMVQNLNYIYKIPKGDKRVTYENYCLFEESSLCPYYGREYSWAAAMDSAGVFSNTAKGCGYGKSCTITSVYNGNNPRGVCPEGWHVPTKKNFEDLFEYVGGADIASRELRATTGWELKGVDYSGDDSYGFSLIPRYSEMPAFWTSTDDYSSEYAYMFRASFAGDGAGIYMDRGRREPMKWEAYPIRCMMDDPVK